MKVRQGFDRARCTVAARAGRAGAKAIAPALRYSSLALALAAGLIQPAAAQTDQAAAPAAPWTPAPFWDSFSLGAELEAGFTGNPDHNPTGVNFGHLFTDRENTFLLNQLSINAQRPVDPKATGFDWGFRIEAMYGSDARYTHFLGEADTILKDRDEFDVVEASVSAHLPYLTDGGVDVKLGQYPTPVGFEVIEPTGNPFYSHSYIFNFGIPLKHTGGYATLHATDTVDLWGGVDSGVNTSLGDGDNNDSPAFLIGFGLNNLLDGKLTVLALSHMGPEDPNNLASPFYHPNKWWRFLNDAVITYKATDALTFVTELNYIKDEVDFGGYNNPDAYGAAEYVSYTLNDFVTLNGRAEIYDDANGFFVAAFPHNLDFVYAEYGLPNSSYNFGKAVYGELTGGVTWKPDVPDAFKGMEIRPELRVDGTLDSTKPYQDGRSGAQVTMAIDLIVPLAIISPPSAPEAAPAPAAAVAPPPPPPPPAVEAQRSFQVFFDFDKSDITDAAAKVIQAAADSAKAGHFTTINVTGHTDTVGTVKYNLALSQRRAAAVKAKLVADGVDAAGIATVGVGKTGLLVPTKDGVREPQNRRAEIVLQ